MVHCLLWILEILLAHGSLSAVWKSRIKAHRVSRNLPFCSERWFFWLCDNSWCKLQLVILKEEPDHPGLLLTLCIVFKEMWSNYLVADDPKWKPRLLGEPLPAYPRYTLPPLTSIIQVSLHPHRPCVLNIFSKCDEMWNCPDAWNHNFDRSESNLIVMVKVVRVGRVLMLVGVNLIILIIMRWSSKRRWRTSPPSSSLCLATLGWWTATLLAPLYPGDFYHKADEYLHHHHHHVQRGKACWGAWPSTCPGCNC